MGNLYRQRGATMWTTMYFVGTLIILGYLGVRLFMPYMDNFKVAAALESASRSGGSGTSREEVAAALTKRFSIDNIDHINLDTDLKVETRGAAQVISLNYEVEIHVMGSFYLLLKFKNERTVR